MTASAEFSVASSEVFGTLRLNKALRNNSKTIGKISLVPLNYTFVVINHKPPMILQKVIKQQQQYHTATQNNAAEITNVIAVRHPGCAQCREHALQLFDLVAPASKVSDDENVMQGVTLFGIVKATGIQNNRRLLNFYEIYFHFPQFVDDI